MQRSPFLRLKCLPGGHFSRQQECPFFSVGQHFYENFRRSPRELCFGAAAFLAQQARLFGGVKKGKIFCANLI
jgi:hypothetical protein